ncbi:MAG: chemotaxis protein CheA [Pirellulales bacterium]
MTEFSVSIEKSIQTIATLARNAECTADELRDGLAVLSKELDQNRFGALALIAETVSAGCASTALQNHELEIAILDLCERLVEAARTEEPFSFERADPNLIGLIFPSEPVATSGTVASGAVTSALNTEANANQPLEASNSAAVEPAQYSNFEEDGHLVICACDDHELMQQFVTESSELIEKAQNLLLAIENRPTDKESLDELFRLIHSLKGAAGVCELDQLIDITHVAENVLANVRDGKLKLVGSAFDVILRAVDFLILQIQSLKSSFQNKRQLQYPSPPHILMSCLKAVDEKGQASSDQLAELDIILGKESKKDAQSSSRGASADSLRVDSKKLEMLVDLIGELVITEGFVQQELMVGKTNPSSSAGVRLRKVVRDIQQLSLSLKMVPINSVLQKMTRLVRELSAKLNKPAQVVIRGADTEVDKTLLESLTDPLVHLIRNSLDHGIESSVQRRIEEGKPEVATIEVTAEHRSGNIHISISDDGAGLNRERIRQRAIESGLITKETRLSDDKIDELIFTPGFSTSQTVSVISGRGVGMDVVRKNVEALRGSISLQSSPNKGTTVRLEFPLTLSIIDGTVVRVGSRWFIFPTVGVIEQIELDQLELQSIQAGKYALFRDHLIQVGFLGKVVGAIHQSNPTRGQVCMVVEAFGRRHGLVVDEIMGQQSIVIKPLGPVLRPLNLFAGCTLLPSGEVGFVLDINAVCRRISTEQKSTACGVIQ